jgi:trimeric autotransporter adhesin
VTSNAPWLQASGGNSGNGTVALTISPNTTLTARTGTVTIAGRSLAVTQPGVPDLTPPTVTVTEPNPNTTPTEMLGNITVRGIAADNGAVAAVTWSNDRGGSGTATGTTAWTISALPLASGLNTITITARDTAGNVARASFRANSRPSSLILTAIGTGSSSPQGDGGLAGQASLGQPSALAFDTQGNLYIAETFNDRVRKVNASDGKISTVAGGNGTGSKGDGGPATAAQLHCPSGVAVDAQGNIYIADRDNHRVRRVAASDGLITTVAGTGTAGFGGDGGDAKDARLDTPYTVAVDRQGNLYISDTSNHRVRKVNASDGKINTVAGTGAIGSAGDGGPATAAQLNEPEQVAFDAQGNFYIADTFNNKIRKVNAADGIISTVAGTGVRGNTGDGGEARSARLGLPEGVWVDAEGNIFIADTFNDLIRKVTPDGRISRVTPATV